MTLSFLYCMLIQNNIAIGVEHIRLPKLPEQFLSMFVEIYKLTTVKVLKQQMSCEFLDFYSKIVQEA